MYHPGLLTLLIGVVGVLGIEMPPEHCPESFQSDLEAEYSWFDLQGEIYREQAAIERQYTLDLHIMDNGQADQKYQTLLDEISKYEQRNKQAAAARVASYSRWVRVLKKDLEDPDFLELLEPLYAAKKDEITEQLRVRNKYAAELKKTDHVFPGMTKSKINEYHRRRIAKSKEIYETNLCNLAQRPIYKVVDEEPEKGTLESSQQQHEQQEQVMSNPETSEPEQQQQQGPQGNPPPRRRNRRKYRGDPSGPEQLSMEDLDQRVKGVGQQVLRFMEPVGGVMKGAAEDVRRAAQKAFSKDDDKGRPVGRRPFVPVLRPI